MKNIELIFGSHLWMHEYVTKEGKAVKEDNIDFVDNIMYFDGKPVFKVKVVKHSRFAFTLEKFSLHRRVIHSVEILKKDNSGFSGTDNLGNTLCYYRK